MKRQSSPADTKLSSDTEEEEEFLLATKPLKATAATSPLANAKKVKLASIFQPRSSVAKPKVDQNGTDSVSSSQLKWLAPIGAEKTCLHGVYGEPKPSSKVAFFDLDGTIVRPKGGRPFPSATDEYDYTFHLPNNVNNIVAKIQQQHREHGSAIVIITNQKQSPEGRNADKPKPKLVTWKKKLNHIARAIDVPLHVFAALSDDVYRKPLLGSWHEFCNHWNDGLPIDRNESFFVGDAAGRSGLKDHNDTDLKWALNAALKFYTPEEYFLDKPAGSGGYNVPSKPWQRSAEGSVQTTLKGLVAQPLDDMVAVTKDNIDTIIRNRPSETQPEIILFVGPPACGKTTFYNKVFGSVSNGPAYVHINQDTLGSRQKCLKLVEAAVSGTGPDAAPRSCVVDNTNRDRATRKHYIDLAQKLGVGIRCVYFSASWALCIHNNFYRALTKSQTDDETKRNLLPYTALQSFFRDVQLPTLDEGFSKGSIFLVDWEFEGSDEERKRYETYHF